MKTNKTRARIRVYGRVQGVRFRKCTLEKAAELGVKGFVKNEEEGTVYAEVEGTPFQVDQMIEWCYIGSPLSAVNKIDVDFGEEVGYPGFEIRS